MMSNAVEARALPSVLSSRSEGSTDEYPLRAHRGDRSAHEGPADACASASRSAAAEDSDAAEKRQRLGVAAASPDGPATSGQERDVQGIATKSTGPPGCGACTSPACSNSRMHLTEPHCPFGAGGPKLPSEVVTLVRSRTFGCIRHAQPMRSVRCACACPRARVWRAHSPFLTLLAPRSDVAARGCLQEACGCHARVCWPVRCGDRGGGSLRRPSARRGGSGEPCPANTDICRYWRFKPWTASVDRGKPLYNTSRGLQPAHLFAADVAAVATVTAAAVTAATTAHAAPLAALRTSPHPSPVIPRSAERVVRGPRLPALLPLHRRCPPASPPASPRHLCRRRLRRLLLRHRHRRPLHHPPHHSTPATPLPPPWPPPPSPPAGRAWAALTGMPGANPGGLPPRRVFCCNLVCA